MADIDIARKAKLQRITGLAKERLGIDEEHIEPIGHYKAKLDLDYVESLSDRKDGKLILVTAITPTPAGEGKTTTTIGLGDALNRIGKNATMCLREPSLGPCFGIKGGAAGGGYAQVVPMEDINLHFTGDFHAVSLAHNLLAAMLDNHIHQGNLHQLDVRRINWRRVVDLNDRALRSIVIALGGVTNGFPRSDGFDIVTASEVMAILCLSSSQQDLKRRLGNIIVGSNMKREFVTAKDLNAQGSMTVLLKDAIKPNLVQTLENNPVFIHGGPFGNIAHGCNSIIATRTALKLSDYVVTEAGFGADLGAEKFFDIKCRKSGLSPSAVVLVATVRALKYHGGVDKKAVDKENLEALEKGVPNLERHIDNIQNVYGMPVIVAINHFTHDTDAEVKLLREKVEQHGAKVVLAEHWAKGGEGAVELAEEVVKMIGGTSPTLKLAYEDNESLWDKINKVGTNVYGAGEVTAAANVRAKLKNFEDAGYGEFPICVAKTQYSFTADPAVRGAPSGFTLPVRDVYVSAGAEFIVPLCGDIMTMPGLSKRPAAEQIDLDEDGNIVGLF
ncbi:MAG: formate--tetrahydrofolate ligase [Acidiferrobacterales bacterium]